MPTTLHYLGMPSFSLSAPLTLSNLVLGLRFGTYTYTLAMFFGRLGEAIGYLGRVLLHLNPFS
jgi:hypothetical protein